MDSPYLLKAHLNQRPHRPGAAVNGNAGNRKEPHGNPCGSYLDNRVISL